MRILGYADLDASGLEDQYLRTTQAIARGDFRAAEVKRLDGQKGLYRAKLDRTDRLIFTLVEHRDEASALILEIIDRSSAITITASRASCAALRSMRASCAMRRRGMRPVMPG